MFRRFSFIVAFVLLLSSTSFAFIQGEGFGIRERNAVQVVGFGSAQGINVAGVGQCQSAAPVGGLAVQRQGALIGQSAAASSFGGTAGVCEAASVAGNQGQIITRRLDGQSQDAGLCLKQDVYKFGCPGSATGAQGGVAGQQQTLITPKDAGAQNQAIGAQQFGRVEGGPGTIAAVDQSVRIHTSQQQAF